MEQHKNVREHKHRLGRNCYLGKRIVVFTACIADKKQLFLVKDVFKEIEDILLESVKKFNCRAHVYLFMPEHCHLIIEGGADDSDLWQFMCYFKQKTGYWISKHFNGYKWQKDFYDHILRKEEDLHKQVRYVLLNPVRKGIVDNWKEYVCKGTTEYDFNTWDEI